MANRSTCAYCGVGCGIEIHTDTDGNVSVKGDAQHPANFGKLCSKGSNLAHTLTLEGRLLHPMINGLRASWPQAIQYVADEFTRIIREHGPGAVAFYVSGQLLIEDYYTANKLMKGFIGSANIDTNSRLCMSSAVAAYKRSFGEDSVPACYEDIEQADLIVLAGSNAAWCHPILFQRIKAAKQKRPGTKVVVIDPRRTPTCEIADLHLAIKPGTDVALFNGLLHHLATHNQLNTDYIEAHCEGFDETLTAAQQEGTLEAIAQRCDLPAEAITQFYQWFADTDRTLTCFSQGINQSSQGTDKGNAIINCHLATGRVGKPGASPFSLTGQPNAMGGREVGGLANQLAAHREFTEADLNTVSQFWNAPNLARSAGLKAVDMFDAIADGTVKAVWVMGTNPAVSLPNANRVVRALQEAELVVVSDCITQTDTNTYAHVLLPAAGWGEKDGTVTNSERRISRQRGNAAAGEARQDWRIISDVARAMGFADAFPFESAADVFREHAQLTALNGDTPRKLNLSDLSQLSNDAYDQMAPQQWPVTGGSSTPRLYGDGQFSTPNGKARFIPVSCQAPANPTCDTWPLVLNTGRIRDQWHTMTRTALAPPLNAHKPEPFVEIPPDTAAHYHLQDGALAQVESRWGQITMRVNVTDALRPNEVFVPIHWNEQWARGARISELVNPALDPYSGQPEAKHTPCRIQPWQPQWSGVMLSRNSLPLPDCQYGAKIRGQHFFRYEMSGQSTHDDLLQQAQAYAHESEPPTIRYVDPQHNSIRVAWVDDHGLRTCLYLGPGHASAITGADRNWLASLFEKSTLDNIERKALLSGKSPAGVEDCGRTVCACFGVGEKTILNAIREHKLTDAAAVGKQLKAGTNCGSCVSEINGLIRTAHD